MGWNGFVNAKSQRRSALRWWIQVDDRASRSYDKSPDYNQGFLDTDILEVDLLKFRRFWRFGVVVSLIHHKTDEKLNCTNNTDDTVVC